MHQRYSIMVSYFYYFTNRIEIIKKEKFLHVIKFVKVRELFPKCKVRFAQAEQLMSAYIRRILVALYGPI